jgi:aspartyl-tRNA(Asn)/glutamyl-tRNA(Gln) amidotransferase subunit A
MVCSWSYDKIGPLARSAADCRLVLEAIAGHDPEDPTSADRPARFPARSSPPLSKLRGAVVRLDFSKVGEVEVQRAFDAAVEELKAAGLALEDTQLPEWPASELAGVIITAEALSTFESFYRDGSIEKLSDRYAPYQPEINQAMTGADLVKAWRLRRVLQDRMAEFFSRYDVIVTPNFMSVAPPVEQDLYEALPYADPVGAVGNSCGLPAIALPCGSGKHGMPVGFQIVAAPYQEALLLDLGDLYQKRTSHHRRLPSLAAATPAGAR